MFACNVSFMGPKSRILCWNATLPKLTILHLHRGEFPRAQKHPCSPCTHDRAHSPWDRPPRLDRYIRTAPARLRMIFVLVPSAREREQRLAVGAYDAITQQVFQAPPGMPVRMQHTRIMYGWPEEAAESDGPEAETPEERARVCSEAEAALEPAPALRLDLERLPPDADVPGAFLCPISLALMQDPVVAADGHSYERCYITRWLASKTVSPKNNTPLASAEFFCNYNLRTAIAQWFEDTALPAAAVSAQTPGVLACSRATEATGLPACTRAATVGDAEASPDADVLPVVV
jgi:hypothetical protein